VCVRVLEQTEREVYVVGQEEILKKDKREKLKEKDRK
jgi:hypothetical protein